MTKNEFLEELKKELKLNSVADIDEIISEYEEHFAFKVEEGFTEEEIAKKLSTPQELAKEYAVSNAPINKYEKGAKTTGVVFMSIPLTMIYILICASVVVLGAFSVASLVAGVCLITTVNIAGLIPSMPYFPSVMLGIACIGLSILSCIGTVYMALYVKQWGKVYIRFCKNLINNNRYPALSKHPKLSKKTASRLKLIAVMGLVIFITAFVVGYIVLCLSAGSIEPWHTYNWFK